MVYLIHCLVWNLLLVTAMAAILWLLGKTRSLRERPALRHSLWLLILLKFITPPLVPMPVLPTMANDFVSSSTQQWMVDDTSETIQFTDFSVWINSEDTAASAPAVTKEESSQWQRFIPAVVIGELALILLVFVAFWFIATRRIRGIGRLTKGLTDTTGGVPDVLERVSSEFKLSHRPTLVLVDEVCSPMLWVGMRRATIILPRSFEQSIDEEQLRHILAHEVAHLVRRDHLSNLVALLVMSLFWWNPIVWLARREMLIAAETCCDAMALDQLKGSRQSYAQTLLAAVDFVATSQSMPPALVARFSESRSLKRRIKMIANPEVQSTLSRWSRLIVLSCGLTALTLLPVQGQQESPEGPIKDSPASDLFVINQDGDLFLPATKGQDVQPNASKGRNHPLEIDLEGQLIRFDLRDDELGFQGIEVRSTADKNTNAGERAKLKALFEQFLDWREQRAKLKSGKGVNSDAGVNGQTPKLKLTGGIEKHLSEGFEDTLNKVHDSRVENGPGTAVYHKPGIKNSKLVVRGPYQSVRAYLFNSKQAAASFAKAVVTFKLATPFKLRVPETEPRVHDADKHKLVDHPNTAEQSGIGSKKMILLRGTPKQHARVEQLMRALGAAE